MSAIHLSPVFPANEQRVIRRALRLLEKYRACHFRQACLLLWMIDDANRTRCINGTQ